jgi:hypothetical protein
MHKLPHTPIIKNVRQLSPFAESERLHELERLELEPEVDLNPNFNPSPMMGFLEVTS